MSIRRNDSRSGAGLYFNKNIYDHRQMLIWPAYTPVTEEVLALAEKRGIPISEEDLETENETLLRAADTAFEELGEMFAGAAEFGKIEIGRLQRSAVPKLIEAVSAAHLAYLLVHLRRKDDPTLRHSIGVAALSIMLGRWLKLSGTELEDLAMAALLHDIGKLRVNRGLLTKPGKLTEEEYEEVKKHTVYGYEMLQRNGLPEIYALAALKHHERFDGAGYPHGLSGDQIEPGCRIIAIADVFHAMSSKRPYKERLPFFQVIREMYAAAFSQFDPVFILTFLKHMMETLIGTEVTLTTGDRATIVALSAADPFRPLVNVNGRFLDLSRHRDIHILGDG